MLESDRYRPSSLLGSRISNGNIRLRFFLISFAGILALGSILYWRSQLLLSQEFVPSPQAVHRKSADSGHKLIKNINPNPPLNEE